MNEEIIKVTAELTAILARNTAGYIFDKIRTVKAKNSDKETIQELEEIISNLIEDKNELQRISQVLSQELSAQRISEVEIKYITDNVLPLLKKFIPASSDISSVEAILSPEILSILQTLGFNYKIAIGEPLTQLVRSFIESNIKRGANS